MSSERLIEELASGLVPVKSRRPLREALSLGVLGVIELGLYLALGYARPDLHAAMVLPSFWWKLVSLGLLTIAGVVTALRSFDPTASPRKGLHLLAVMVGLALVAGWMIDSSAPDGHAVIARLMWRHGIDCVVAMAILSIPPIVALGLLMRRGAPTDLSGSALAIGTASAAWGAFVFVFNCPHDDPVYVAVWYVVGCSIVALAGRLILPRIARW